MKTHLLAAFAVLFGLLATVPAEAGSDAEFPQDWRDWPIVGEGAIPGKDTPVPADLPPVVQETVKTYNWIADGAGSAYNIRIHSAQAEAFKARSGDYADGPTGVIELIDAGVILVTDHLLGEPQYGAFTFDGTDVSDAHPSLAPAVCTTCHSGYGDACVAGICRAAP